MWKNMWKSLSKQASQCSFEDMQEMLRQGKLTKNYFWKFPQTKEYCYCPQYYHVAWDSAYTLKLVWGIDARNVHTKFEKFGEKV